MRGKQNQYECNEEVRLKSTGEIVTIKDFSYVENMKRFAYTLKEHPETFFFEEEITEV